MDARDEPDLDELERRLATELDLLVKLAELGVGSGSVKHAEHTLRTLVGCRPEAQELAGAGRPVQAQRLEAIIADLAAAAKTMGATDATLREIDTQDRQAQIAARTAGQAVTKGTIAQVQASEAKRAAPRKDQL